MSKTRKNSAHAPQDAARGALSSHKASLTRAAYYGLYLRNVAGLDAGEAAALVMERYPLARPFLERLTRPAVIDPLAEICKGFGDVNR